MIVAAEVWAEQRIPKVAGAEFAEMGQIGGTGGLDG